MSESKIRTVLSLMQDGTPEQIEGFSYLGVIMMLQPQITTLPKTPIVLTVTQAHKTEIVEDRISFN